jgi:hypothetical protein
VPQYKDVGLFDNLTDFIMQGFHEGPVTLSKTRFAFALMIKYYSVAKSVENTDTPLVAISRNGNEVKIQDVDKNLCHRAVQYDVFPVLMFFLEKRNVSLDEPFSDAKSLFARFCTKGSNRMNRFNTSCAKLLVERYHAKPDVRFQYYESTDPINSLGEKRETSLLELACEHGDFDLARCLVKNGATADGATVLGKLPDGPVKAAIVAGTL